MKKILTIFMTAMILTACMMPARAHEVAAIPNESALVPLDYELAHFAKNVLGLDRVPTHLTMSQMNTLRLMQQTCEYTGTTYGDYYVQTYGTHAEHTVLLGDFDNVNWDYDDVPYYDHPYFNLHQHYGSFNNMPFELYAYDYDENSGFWDCNKDGIEDALQSGGCTGYNMDYHYLRYDGSAEYVAYLYCDYWGFSWQTPRELLP